MGNELKIVFNSKTVRRLKIVADRLNISVKQFLIFGILEILRDHELIHEEKNEKGE